MQTKDEEKSKLPAYVIFNDIDSQKKQFKDDYSPETISLAEDVRALATAAYSRSNVYLNYRAKFIAVKVDKPQQGDKIQNYKQIDALDEFVSEHTNINIKNVRSNLIFEIYE